MKTKNTLCGHSVDVYAGSQNSEKQAPASTCLFFCPSLRLKQFGPHFTVIHKI
jgi:hypothetical protein